MSDQLQVQQKAKPITQYPVIMIGFGFIMGWIAHELYVAYKLAELGLL